MKRSIPKPTKAQQELQDAARALGCLVCRMIDAPVQCGPTEIQHCNSGGRNRGQDFTFALGSYHHRGICLDGWSAKLMREVFGPDARHSKPFHAAFGSDDELIALQNEHIGVLA